MADRPSLSEINNAIDGGVGWTSVARTYCTTVNASDAIYTKAQTPSVRFVANLLRTCLYNMSIKDRKLIFSFYYIETLRVEL